MIVTNVQVGEAENEKTLSVHEHLSTAASFNEAEREVKRLQKSLRSAINKSRWAMRGDLQTMLKDISSVESQKAVNSVYKNMYNVYEMMPYWLPAYNV